MSVRASALIAAAAALLLAGGAWANRVGLPGRARVGCGGGGCHTGGEAPTLALDFGGQALPGATVQVTLHIEGGQVAAGVGLEATGGRLRPAAGLKAVPAAPMQLVHDGGPIRYPEGATDVTFEWIAPDAPGDYTLFAAVNSVNDNFLPTGDQWALVSAALTVVDDAPVDDAGAPGTSPDAAPTSGGGGDDDGCAAQPASQSEPAAVAAFLAFAALLLRRRR